MEEFVFQKRVRLFKWNVKSPSHEHHVLQGQVLFLIKSRFVSAPATSNVRFSHPISYSFQFNPECLSSTNNVQKLAYEAVLSTQQFHEQRNIAALANTISEYLVKNYNFGVDTFSKPNAPKVLIVVEVNKTWVLKGFQDYGIGEIERDQFNGETDDYETTDEENILLRMRNLLRVPVFSVLEPSDISEPLGLTQVPGLDLFELCDVGALAADQGTCAICLEGLSMDSCRKTPCSHVFHGGCIAQWLWRKRSCPMCRSQLA
ncbi:E3 ubiquitin-protein ligase ATL9-like [Durio zibethinus]|uniref:E3 ubiquitin-protein ligase ATL9-like n=1 Tax=Durio zibethinus TaxID=66656 RepID=A0A6P5ZFL5_DURZI|nr:E3 ubiquitin-protein ligase ATL9-like [Durio zibethinus]